MIKEELLDVAFADAIRDYPVFLEWFIGKTKFRDLWPHLRLLHEEQRTLRVRKHWAKWWFCRVPELENKESETDIFLVFEIDGAERVALHIENKPWKGRFGVAQAGSYAARAKFMLGKPKFMNYNDFQTIILAPRKFIEQNEEGVSLFDVSVSYEEVGCFVQLFKIAA